MIVRDRKDKKDRKPRKKASFLPYRKKVCQFCTNKSRVIDYKDLRTLENFIRERGRLISTRASGNCAKHQRQLARAIRKARFIALLPYVKI